MPGKEFQSAQVECDSLREENNRMRKLLTVHGMSIPATQAQGPTLVQSGGSAIAAVSPGGTDAPQFNTVHLSFPGTFTINSFCRGRKENLCRPAGA